jgi:hypothetical protein
VFGALERAGKSVPRGAALATVDRKRLEEQFPHGLAALEQETGVALAAVSAPPPAGPPSVSRRQASLLWSYLEGGRTTPPGSAAASTLR